MTPEFLALQRSVAGRYSLDRELGRGGMGVVFLARDVALDRAVAIKLLPLELARSPRHRESFLREARTAAGLAHPHIVPIHAVEAHEDIVFFVMMYVDGETLGARIARLGRLSMGEVARIVREVAWAVGHAHAHGIIHRDIKPDNVILERGTDRAMVTDFGIAAAVGGDAGAVADGKVVGTPRFMSPEQACGEAVDGRSDVYSLGCLAWTAATGHAPYESATVAGLLTQHLAAPVPSLRAVRPTAPAALATAIERCLAKSPADRFASAEALSVELRRAESAGADGPPALRAFARELSGACGEATTALTLVGVIIALVVVNRVVPYQDDFGGLTRLFEMYYYVAAAAGIVGIASIRFGQLAGRARALARAGYTAASMRPVLAAEDDGIEDGPQERASWKQVIAVVTTAVAGTAIAKLASGNASTVVSFVGLTASLAIPTVALRSLYGRFAGADGAWSRTVRRGLARAAFAVGRLGLRRDQNRAAVGEPTIVALSDAVGALYHALPADERRALAGVPELIGRLEVDAAALRARRHPGDDERYVVAIAAMESLRLDLMRLRTPGADRHAITGELTRDIDRARRIGNEIDGLLRIAAPGEPEGERSRTRSDPGLSVP